jgi:hypothetical protein
MPNWARLPGTRKDVSLGYRMTSVLEDGYGDAGPLATVLAVGGCFGAILIASAIIIGVPVGILWWLGTLVF